MTWQRGPVAVGIVVAILIVMLGIPLLGLLSTRPARFGWQMYTVANEAPKAWARTADGNLEPLRIVDHFAVLRGDLPDADAVASAMCAFTDAGRVAVELRPGVTGEVACP